MSSYILKDYVLWTFEDGFFIYKIFIYKMLILPWWTFFLKLVKNGDCYILLLYALSELSHRSQIIVDWYRTIILFSLRLLWMALRAFFVPLCCIELVHFKSNAIVITKNAVRSWRVIIWTFYLKEICSNHSKCCGCNCVGNTNEIPICVYKSEIIGQTFNIEQKRNLCKKEFWA